MAECFHQHSWWLEPSLFHSGFCLAGLSAAVHFDLNKLGKVAQLTNSICLTKLGACTTVKMMMAGIFFEVSSE